jgi:hypothetical protein
VGFELCAQPLPAWQANAAPAASSQLRRLKNRLIDERLLDVMVCLLGFFY